MGRKVSDAETRRQIEREGKRWGLAPMVSIFSTLLVAEEIPCVIPLSPGVMVLDRVKRDITAVTQEYPFGALLRNRKHKGERNTSLRLEVTRQIEENAAAKRLEEIYRELHSDLKRADKQRVVRYGANIGRS